jgi:hypothetical protein
MGGRPRSHRFSRPRQLGERSRAAKPEKEKVNYARENAAAVFSGVVTEVVVSPQLLTYEAKFRVRESWKGVDSEG